uniref:Uncharacterized protein n=1 Tax=Fagus sylvatica TaxID=28930 RepID=A0A2N9HD58_FAGSY
MEDLRDEIAAKEAPRGAVEGGVDVVLVARDELADEGAGGRSAKMAPFWTRDLWARVWLAMKMKGLKLMRRVMMGPYLAWCLRRMGSTSEDLRRSNRKLPRMGMVKGPGGSLLFLETLGLMRRLRRALRCRE